jgi:hypothetical protein
MATRHEIGVQIGLLLSYMNDLMSRELRPPPPTRAEIAERMSAMAAELRAAGVGLVYGVFMLSIAVGMQACPHAELSLELSF